VSNTRNTALPSAPRASASFCHEAITGHFEFISNIGSPLPLMLIEY
jgi:hypothetical protein